MRYIDKLLNDKEHLNEEPMDIFLEQYHQLVDYVFEDITLSPNALDNYQLALTEVMKKGELPNDVVGGFGGAMEMYAKARAKMIT